MIPEQNDHVQQSLQEDISFRNNLGYLSSNLELWSNKDSKDKLSPFQDKRSRGFEPYSPTRQQSSPSRNLIILSQSPILGRPYLFPSPHQFDDLEITTMYGLGFSSPYQLKKPIPFFQAIPPPITYQRLEYNECGQDQNSNGCTTNKTNPVETKYRIQACKKFFEASRASTQHSKKKSIAEGKAEKTETKKAHNTNNKKKQAIQEEDSGSDEGAKSGMCRTRGLKSLSSSIRDIVVSLKQTTYKEVAKILIMKLQQQNVIVPNSKDELNVKRRVYDALNVLIAARVLKKQGKLVMVEIKQQQESTVFSKQLLQQKANLEQAIKEKSFMMTLKAQKAQGYVVKYNALRSMIKRNVLLNVSQDEKILFPFVTIPFHHGQMQLNSSQQQKSFAFQKNFEIVTDLDALVMLYESGRFKKPQQQHLS